MKAITQLAILGIAPIILSVVATNPTAEASCIHMIWSGEPFTRIALANECDEARIATINFTDYLRSWTEDIAVPAYGRVEFASSGFWLTAEVLFDRPVRSGASMWLGSSGSSTAPTTRWSVTWSVVWQCSNTGKCGLDTGVSFSAAATDWQAEAEVRCMLESDYLSRGLTTCSVTVKATKE